MEAQLHRPSNERHRHDETAGRLHSSEGEHNHHGEKKSVLKRVKDKAKKIKKSITKHVHGHEHEHEHDYRHDRMSEEEDEETENDPELHGAPVIRGTALPTQTAINKPIDTHEERSIPHAEIPKVGSEAHRPANPAMDADIRCQPAEEDPHAPADTPDLIPPSNYQSKVSDPTGEGSREADIAPLARRFDDSINVRDQALFKPGPESESYNMNVQDQSDLKARPVLEAYTSDIDRMNIRDRADLKPMPEVEAYTDGFDSMHVRDRADLKHRPESEAYTGCFDSMNVRGRADLKPRPESMASMGGPESPDRMNVQDRVNMKPRPESKVYTGGFDRLDVHDQSHLNPLPQSKPYTGSHDPFAPQKIPMDDEFKPESNPAGENPATDLKRCDPDESDSMPVDTVAGKISTVASAIADKAVSAKNLVESKLGFVDQGPEDHDLYRSDLYYDDNASPVTGLENAESEYMPVDTTAGSLSGVASAIADKAVSAKNSVASKLGFVDQGPENQDSYKSDTVGPVTGLESAEFESTPVDATSGSISAVASVIADKAVSAKNLVASKLGYDVNESPEGQDLSKKSDSECKDETKWQTDKGVSVKEYLVEKFRLGDEDKALSEAITGALEKKKDGMEEATDLLDRIKESEEVAARLGTYKENNKKEMEDAVAAGRESSGAGVVDQLKDAVGEWLGKSTGIETAKQSDGQSYGASPGEVSSHDRRLQESGN